MRFLIAAMAIVLLTVTAHAQGMGRSQKGELKKEHQAKKKVDQEKRRRLRTHTKTHLKVYPNLVKSLILGKPCASEVDLTFLKVALLENAPNLLPSAEKI